MTLAAYVVDSTLVRGLDYYTRTVFEFESDKLGAQSGVGGGGRYDGLVEELGGPPHAGRRVGRGHRADPAGVGEQVPARRRGRSTSRSTRRQRRAAFALVTALREAGVRSEVEQAGRSLKGQLKHADRIAARGVFIVGDGDRVEEHGYRASSDR